MPPARLGCGLSAHVSTCKRDKRIELLPRTASFCRESVEWEQWEQETKLDICTKCDVRFEVYPRAKHVGQSLALGGGPAIRPPPTGTPIHLISATNSGTARCYRTRFTVYSYLTPPLSPRPSCVESWPVQLIPRAYAFLPSGNTSDTPPWPHSGRANHDTQWQNSGARPDNVTHRPMISDLSSPLQDPTMPSCL
jgi:hypothetical protein